ncbi:MAG: hypothetical protein Kow0022_03650 [Phycisphaerales bacterium]
MLTPDLIRSKFEAGLTYDAYVATGKPADRQAWQDFASQLELTASQAELLRSFKRIVHIVAVSGTWCGDCVKQIPFLRLFEKARPDVISLRCLDRDEHADLASRLTICGGMRVPVVVFANEDFDFLALEGDRSLSRYRALASRQLGASCEIPTARVAADEIARTQADWLGALERVQLMCRLSTKLRERYGD